MKINQPAVVFGLFETGLGVARALGRKGVQVIGVDHKKDIGWYSKYVRPLKCPNPLENEKAFLRWVSNNFSRDHDIPVFFTGDDFLYPFSKNREALREYFRFNLPEHKKLEQIADKYSQYLLAKKAGLNVPQTWLIDNASQIKEGNFPDDCWPLIIKGREVNSWRKIYGGTKKGFKVNDFHELGKLIKPALEQNLSIIAQEIIEGPDTNHFKYSAYRTDSGKILAEFCLQKIRQNPIRFGIGSVVKSIKKPALLKSGRQLFENIDYQGIGSAEFKLDEKDGKLKLIELNPRYWQQNTLAETCGINFPFLNYQDLLEKEPSHNLSTYRLGVKWVNIYMDFKSFLDYKKEGEITFPQWLQSLSGPKVFSDYALDDPIPGLWEIRFGKRILKLPQWIAKNARQKTHLRKLQIKNQAHV
ncbi:MAG: hypothetical protein DWQ02_20665 [Bacteroidetes bacterium]|nr:MAG: hypothetical protein DWQ02_20665 [Bacteroidota bacterium]